MKQSTIQTLLQLLLAVEDVKNLAPYAGQTADVLCLESRMLDVAASARNRVLTYANRMYIADCPAGNPCSPRPGRGGNIFARW